MIWRRCHVYALFTMWTLFAVFVYRRFSTLGDSHAYLTGGYVETGSHRTALLSTIASLVYRACHSELAVHLLFSSFAATGIACMLTVQPTRLHWSQGAILFNPNFGTWTASIGREAIFCGLLGLFLASLLHCVASQHDRSQKWHLPVMAACLGGMIYIREAFGVIFALFGCLQAVHMTPSRARLDWKLQALAMLVAGTFVLLLAGDPMVEILEHSVLPKAKSYFTIHSATTRTWIELETVGDYLGQFYWMLPTALIGPTLTEVVHRMVFLPIWIGGLMVVSAMANAVLIALQERSPNARKFLVLAWMPAVALLAFVYVPFGIYNPGSGIRYASSMLPFALFPRLLREVLRGLP